MTSSTPRDPAACPDCSDFTRTVSRRDALRLTAGVAGGVALAATFGEAFVETAYAATGHAERVLVVLSMRGAADGMSLVVPHGDPVYYQARPNIAVPKTSLLAGDAFFGLHPALAPLLPMWNAGQIAAIPAAGQIVTTRSHFAAMEEVEDADPGSTARVGWLNRLLSLNPHGVDILNGLQLGGTFLNTQAAGPVPVLAAEDLDRIKLAGPTSAAWQPSLQSLWQQDTAISASGRQAIAIAEVFEPVRAGAVGTGYPSGDLGDALAATARVIKSDVGAEVITVDQGSWDHHQWVGTVNDGNLKRMATPFAAALAAFFADLGALADRVTVVTISEFGRRVKENANQGLDHGHATVMFALGAGVKGGYYGTWPGIENTQNADLPVTTDYRDVLGEVVRSVFPERSLSVVFPDLIHAPLGFMRIASAPDPTTPPTTDPETPGTTPTPTPTKNGKKKQPKSFYASFGAKLGKAIVGKPVVAPQPMLSKQGKKAGITVSYRWETVGAGAARKVTKHGQGRRVRPPKSWVGSTLQVRITYRAAGYRPLVRVVRWGKVRPAG